jgi:hypothetical protein
MRYVAFPHLSISAFGVPAFPHSPQLLLVVGCSFGVWCPSSRVMPSLRRALATAMRSCAYSCSASLEQVDGFAVPLTSADTANLLLRGAPLRIPTLGLTLTPSRLHSDHSHRQRTRRALIPGSRFLSLHPAPQCPILPTGVQSIPGGSAAQCRPPGPGRLRAWLHFHHAALYTWLVTGSLHA